MIPFNYTMYVIVVINSVTKYVLNIAFHICICTRGRYHMGFGVTVVEEVELVMN